MEPYHEGFCITHSQNVDFIYRQRGAIESLNDVIREQERFSVETIKGPCTYCMF